MGFSCLVGDGLTTRYHCCINPLLVHQYLTINVMCTQLSMYHRPSHNVSMNRFVNEKECDFQNSNKDFKFALTAFTKRHLFRNLKKIPWVMTMLYLEIKFTTGFHIYFSKSWYYYLFSETRVIKFTYR